MLSKTKITMLLKEMKKIDQDAEIVRNYITLAVKIWNHEHPDDPLNERTIKNLNATIEDLISVSKDVVI